MTEIKKHTMIDVHRAEKSSVKERQNILIDCRPHTLNQIYEMIQENEQVFFSNGVGRISVKGYSIMLFLRDDFDYYNECLISSGFQLDEEWSGSNNSGEEVPSYSISIYKAPNPSFFNKVTDLLKRIRYVFSNK